MAVIIPASISDAEVPDINGITSRPVVQPSKKHLPNGNHIAVSTGTKQNGKESSTPEYAIPMHDQLAFTRRKIRVITVGAGFSGLIMAHKFQHRFPDLQDSIEHKILEARGDIGGTWLVNTYPGVQCDVPSHIYVSARRTLRETGEAIGTLTECFPRRFLLTRIRNGLDSTRVEKRSMSTSKRQLQSGISNETCS